MMSLSLPPRPEPQMTYLQDAGWSHFQAQASAASTPPWALPGWGGRMQTAGSQVDWSQEVLSPPHPHACPHACACTGLSACAEVFPLVRRCGSKCLCQMHHRPWARVSVENALGDRGSSAKPSPSPPAARSSVWGWRSRAGQGAPHPPPSLGQCQLELSIEDPTVAAYGPPKGCQWVSVPSLP